MKTSLHSGFQSLLLSMTLLLGLAVPLAAQTLTWTNVTPMNTARVNAAAVVLNDGKVLVTGGPDSTAERYDPVAGTWTTINMVSARWLHRAEKLPDGRVLVIAGAVSGTRNALNTAEIYDPATGTFSAVASLAESRETFASTVLSNGKVLVHGGWNGGSVRSSGEVYDPATNTWTATGPSVPRNSHELVTLPNGKALMISGHTGAVHGPPECYLYDPAANTWAATGSMGTGRAGPQSVVLANGKVLTTGESATCELYDPALGTWSYTGSMSVGRGRGYSILLSDGRVLAFGGVIYPPMPVSSEIYDPAAGTWSATGSAASGRTDGVAVRLQNGVVLAAGGSVGTSVFSAPASANVAIFDAPPPPPAPTVASISPSVGSTTGGTVVTITGTNLTGATGVTIGGTAAPITAITATEITATTPAGTAGTASVLVTTPGGTNAANTLFTYQLPPSLTWTLVTPMNTTRSYAAAVVLNDGKVLVTGGQDASNNVLSTAERYDPVAGTWTTISMVAGRWLHRAEKLADGRVLVIAGANQSRTALNSAEIYDPATGNFSAVASLAESREEHASAVLSDGKVLVHGGWVGSGIRSSGEVYDPATNTWTATTGTNVTRVEHELVRLTNGKVLMIGGHDGSYQTTCYLYDPATNAWTATGSLTNIRPYSKNVVLSDGKVLAAGHSVTCELYDPAAGTWSITGSMSTARSRHNLIQLGDGRVLAIGGGNASSEIYNPATSTWSAAAALNNSRALSVAVRLLNGDPLVAGGHNGSATTNTVETFDAPPPPPAPTVASVSPASGSTAGGTIVTITGTGFSGATAATFGGTNATSYTVDSATQITATTPARAAGAVSVEVTTAGGTNAANTLFNYQVNSNGVLDTDFDTDGIRVVSTAGVGDGARSVMEQPDGKIILAGTVYVSSEAQFAAMRLMPDGVTLDASFGTGGIVTFSFGAGYNCHVNDAKLQSDGKIALAGYVITPSFQFIMAVARLDANGALDTTFDTDGKRLLSPRDVSILTSLVIQPDGKLVLAGYSRLTSGDNDVTVYRMLPTGALDTSFDTDGLAFLSADVGADEANDVVLQADGKLVLTGQGANVGAFVCRLTSAGAADTTFDTDGIALANQPGSGVNTMQAVKVLADGDIATVGTTSISGVVSMSVLRFTPSGALDTTFDTDGRAVVSVGTSSSGYDVVEQADGRLLVGGSANVSGNLDFALARLTAAGALDPTFHGTGSVTTPIGAGHDEAFAMALQADGKPVLGGRTHNGTINQFAAVRYTEGVITTPTVTSSTASLASNATTLIITGTGFDTTPGNNTVVFNNGAVGTVTAASATELTVTFSTQPTSFGSLTAVVTNGNGSSGAPVQVATVSNIIATLTGGALTITDMANGNDTLSLSESAGDLVITADVASVINSNAGTGSGTNSVSIPLASITGLITVNAAGGTDIINVGGFATTLNGLTLNGGTASDTVNLNGDLTLAANASLDADLSNDDVSPGTDSVVVAASANLIVTGTGTITLKGAGAVSMAAGSSVESVNGAIAITSTASGLSLAGATVTTSGTGNLTLAGTGVGDGGGISISGGSVISSTGSGLGVGEGLLTLTGTGSGFGTGIALSGASSVTSVAGAISMTGTGNGGSNGRTSKGIIIDASTVQSTGAATVSLNGKGNSFNFASDTNAQHHGIQVTGATALITSSAGKITLDGDGRFGRSSNNFGVVVQNGAGVTGTAAAEVELIGITRIASSIGSNGNGIVITDTGSRVTTVNGPLKLTGTGSDQANSKGVLITTDGQVASTAGDITITGRYVGGGTATGVGILYDSATAVSTSGTINLVSGSGIAARMMLSNGSISGTAGVTVRGAGGAAIDLGSVTDSASRADLSDTELDMITTSGTLSIGDAGSGEIIISAPITRSASTAMALTSATSIIFNPGSIDTAGGVLTLNSGFFGSVQPITSGTDVTTSAATAVAFGVGSQLGIAFAGAVEETDYSPLSVAGQVNLTGVFLLPSGAYVPAVSDSFTLLTNDGTDAITGTFAGLPEGAVIPNFLGSGFGFKISYTGGTGNDVVLSIANTAPTITSNGGGAAAAISVAENTTAVTTVVASDAEVPATQAITYSKSGTNEGLFNIDSGTGVLTFITAPNFEAAPGPFSVTVTATDNGSPNLSASQDLTITVTNVNEAPVIVNLGSAATGSLDFSENIFNSFNYAFNDPDVGQTQTYALSGPDEALFTITAGGVLTFVTPRDFETRTDANTDGVYEVTVTVTDNGAVPLSDSQALVITVTNRNEVPTFTGGSSPLHTADTGAKTVPGWATAMDDGDSTVTQALTFTVVQNGGAAIFGTAPTIAADGTLSYTLNGTTGTANLYAYLTDDNAVTPHAALNSFPNYVFSITNQTLPDYEVTYAGGALTVTDLSGVSGTVLYLYERADEPGRVRFFDAGRTFSVNGGLKSTTETSVSFLMTDLTGSVTMNAGAGNNTIRVQTNIPGNVLTLPSLTINGGAGDDTVQFAVSVNFLPGASLDVDLQNDAGGAGLDTVSILSNVLMPLLGTGSATIKSSGSITVGSSAQLTTVNGNLTLEANQQAVPSVGSFNGVHFNGSAIVQASGTGQVTVKGRSGNGTGRHGVVLNGGASISGGTTGTLSVTAVSNATSAGGACYGLLMGAPASMISTTGANIVIEGTTAATGSGNGGGVWVDGSVISAGGAGTVSVTGTGGSGGFGSSYGVVVWRSGGTQNGSILSNGGDVTVVGNGGSGTNGGNHGVYIFGPADIRPGTNGNLSITGTCSTTATGGGNSVGVNMTNAVSLGVSGTGTLLVNGTGGNASGGNNSGVLLNSGGAVPLGSGNVTITGTAGIGGGSGNQGVNIAVPLTSTGGNISITGTGKGVATTNVNHGVTTNVLSTTGSGTITVQGTAATTAGGWGFQANGAITTAGGSISLTGVGGGAATDSNSRGIMINNVAVSGPAAGSTLTLHGTGASTTGNIAVGVELFQAGAQVSTTGGDIAITGIGGANSSQFSMGFVLNGGSLSVGGTGKINLTGTGGANLGVTHGIWLLAGSISTNDGDITLTGTAGGQPVASPNNFGILNNVNVIAGGTGVITLVADSMNLGGSLQAVGDTITARPRTAGTPILIGGADVLTGSLALGLLDFELDTLNCATVTIGAATSGPITVSSVISPANHKTFVLKNNTSFTNAVFFSDIGATASVFEKITVEGTVTVDANSQLNFSPTGGYFPALGDSFTIIDNDGTSDAVTGSFFGKAEGATITNFVGTGLNARITYLGGDGNDVVVTVQNIAPVITSNGGGATASISVAENTTLVTTVMYLDPDVPQTKTYSLSGTDVALFNLNSGGLLTFIAPPDFEGAHGNTYTVTVTVTDNGTPILSDSQDLTITVTDVADPLTTASGEHVITSAGAPDATGADSGAKFDLLKRGGFLADNGHWWCSPANCFVGSGSPAVTSSPNTFMGIWKDDGTGLKLLARSGDPAPEAAMRCLTSCPPSPPSTTAER
jgi:uncharacterized delta-60 repeat protein